ncbi:MAG TPA: hypothetical protein VNO30_12310 [Kofleriaceae bacterium]|nr:hypothetical protein [Kofleriaceae bacterium]
MLEEGLARYGRGDFDGAVVSWEQVLDLDPHHEQALGYIDYVRMNYELLVSEVSAQAEVSAFPLDDEPTYQIEAAQGELAEGDAVPRYVTALDGWAIEEEEPALGRLSRQAVTLDLEPDLEQFHLTSSPEPELPGMNFEDATKEYEGLGRQSGQSGHGEHGGPGGQDAPGGDEGGSEEFRSEVTPTPGFESEATPGFGAGGDAHTPQAFVTQRTQIRPRDLGFVQPVTSSGVARLPGTAMGSTPELPVDPAVDPAGDLVSDLARDLAREAPSERPGEGPGEGLGEGLGELLGEHETILRRRTTPYERTEPAPEHTESAFDPAGALFDLPSDIDPPTIDRSPGSLPPELFNRLPVTPSGTREFSPGGTPPRRAGPPGRSTIEGLPPVHTSSSPPSASPASSTPSLPLTPSSTAMSPGASGTRQGPPVPGGARAPSGPGLPAYGEPGDFDAPTERKEMRSSSSSASSPDLAAKGHLRPGARAPQPSPLEHNLLITAPTRDLGIRPDSSAARPEGTAAAQSRSRTEDLPLGPFEPDAPQRARPMHKVPAVTHADAVLPFDPIDARSAQILDAIDRRAPAPPDETPEDRTRRRITALFDYAVEWNKAGELDRAVTAIDLALSEDPSSVLAQKLVQRNRETMMNVFQAFLGDLHRMPVLARPLHELAGSHISSRAAFLLSRVDGLLSIDEILDVSGMPRLEAYRYLCQLFLRGILR